MSTEEMDKKLDTIERAFGHLNFKLVDIEKLYKKAMDILIARQLKIDLHIVN